jgi:hypothetical protein
MTKSLVLKALDQAYQLQRPKGNVLHHSDRAASMHRTITKSG